jgi:hypothetical protein
MYYHYDKENGYPPRLYRVPEEIRRDIDKMLDMCRDANRMFNVRNLISEIIIDDSGGDVDRKICAIEELILAAEDMVEEMQSLVESLGELQDELTESLSLLKS